MIVYERFTIKNHKERFREKIFCRLKNPSKTDIGKINKQILDRVNNNKSEKKQSNQCENTSSVIKWYGNIKRKDQCSFVVFDIANFHWSISTKLFNKALSFAKLISNFTCDQLEIIRHSKKHFCFSKIVLGLKKRAMKILTYQWDIMMAQN